MIENFCLKKCTDSLVVKRSKELAEEKIKVMQDFITQLRKEIE